ncbi:MAG: D-alanyl-D-alanine carboxypeptidase [Micavibrio sp.]|nr:D-alanyl-D-alanine carboxypeptidase [Micavibrio sp.]
MVHNVSVSGFLRPVAAGLCTIFAFSAMPAEAAKKHQPVKHNAVAKKKQRQEQPTPQQRDGKIQLRSSVAIDGETGKIIGEVRNANGEIIDAGECNPKPAGCFQRRSPASLTKLMTAMVEFDAIKAGEVKITDRHPLVDGEMIGRQGAVTLKKKGIRPGTNLSLDDYTNAIAVTSAADATMTVSKALCGTTDCIVDLMNAKLKVIFRDNVHGLHTNFANPHGMPDDEQYTTAYDQAVIVRYMAKNYHDLATKYFGKTEYHIGVRLFTGHNGVLAHYTCKNSLGLPYNCMEFGKTGYFKTPEPGGLPAMYCVAGSAAWNGYRVIAATLGYGSPGNSGPRDAEETRLFKKGFEELTKNRAPQTVPMPLHFPTLIPPNVAPEPDQTQPTSQINTPLSYPGLSGQPSILAAAAPR